MTGLNTFNYFCLSKYPRKSLTKRSDTYLELAAGTSNADSSLVTHDLSSNHGQCLALCGIDLARHDRAARLVFRQAQLTETASRSGAEVPDVIGDLHEGAGDDVQGTVGLNKRVMGCKSFKLIRSSLEFKAGDLRDRSCDFDVEAFLGVEAL